jgi:hypothetical protein
MDMENNQVGGGENEQQASRIPHRQPQFFGQPGGTGQGE